MASVFQLNDLILLIVVVTSMVAGIFLNDAGVIFQPLPMYCLMGLFSLSFMSIEVKQIRDTLRNSAGTIVLFTIVKIVVFPVAVYFLFIVLLPSYAVAAMLLAGVSTGVVAPFISNLVLGNSPLVLVMVVVTSVLIPFTLPSLINVLLSRSVDLSLFAMIKMLAMVIFIPIIAVEALRHLAPNLMQHILKKRFPLSLLLFAVINLGVFSRYADAFHRDPSMIIVASIVAVVLSVICCLTGLAIFWGSSVEDQMAGAVSMGNMNNVLVIVFSSHFFGPKEPTVAAMYLIPFYGLIIPLRYYYRWYVRSFSRPIRSPGES
jgi:bile acid:Na+ symporter, BASS family